MAIFLDNWRPRRSVLFMPASNRRAIAKASVLKCDAVIFDLEDSVSPIAQNEARENLLNLVKGKDFGHREIIIRVSSPESREYSHDITTAIECAPHAILIPKVESVAPINNLAAMLSYSGATDVDIWAMIETPRAIINLEAITTKAEKLTCLVVGPNDLARDSGILPTPDRAALVPWLMTIIAHGRANQLTLLDGVLNNFNDAERLRLECEQGATLGFDGKTLIHPAQIEAANRAFSPSEEQISRAKAIIDLFSNPENKGAGALNLNGEMVEILHFENAKNLLNYSDQLQS